MKLLLATKNPHKVEEIRAIFDIPSLEILSAVDYDELPDVEEDGDTFEANAKKKAVTLARLTGLWALADDPGVYSARFAGEPCDYEANNRKLLKMMEAVEERSGRFRCVMALSSPTGEAETVDGTCEGTIITAPRGDAGFGYDPVFVPEGFQETFAEMPAEQKNKLSHRGHALAEAKVKWDKLFRE
jgi:XTP/dITP diphosphohydrolase